MKYTTALVTALMAAPALAFAPIAPNTRSASTALNAEIRPKTEKSEELRFGWDGTTALGGAVENAAPARMLEDIRAAGETIPDECEIFNANLEMDASDLTFEDVMELIDTHYESQLLEFKNGDMLNKQGENEGSAKILSYAALSNLDKDLTLKLWGQYYRDVVASPDGDDHQNIRNFMKTGWEGVPFENGIALTRKQVGENEWDAFAESWIP
ncbi:HopJ type III effector protein [Seminavis robusta]|uniref:HopJ type III effector protein n=1 Tax=Seminavis robusta TaxID=568900 RepID=A0A9N8E5K8_9STRA|nr:HopJ type III effector protein [Seminavis robusta]|eukprot:Sro686_g186990.1 HopJ type III effector protein (212) ;mRNA; r:863-1613